MKKNTLFIIPLIIFLLFPFTSAKAITKINFKQTSNGNIETTMHFDEGFVGGIEFKVKLSDTVQVKDFTFNKNYETSNFTRRFSYNSTTHILTVRVTSGGIGAGHNLLNKERELMLGTINLGTNSKTSVDYTLSAPTLSYIDNSWKLEPIANNNLTLGETTKFTYLVNQTENPPKEENPSQPEEQKPSETPGSSTTPEEQKPTDDNKEDNNNQSSKPSGTDTTDKNNNTGATSSSNSNTESSNKTENKTPASGTTTDKKDDTTLENKDSEDKENNEEDNETKDEDDTIDDSSSYTTPSTSNDSKTKENEEKISKVVIVTAVIAIVLVVLLILFAILKNRDKKNIDF